MNIITKNKFLILGLLFAITGLALMYKGNNKSLVAQAATTSTYTTSWKATKLLQVKGTASATFLFNNTKTDEQIGVPIGVAQWVVNGTMSNGISYTESWDTPEVAGVSLAYGFSPGSSCGATYDPTKWLVSCVNAGVSPNVGAAVGPITNKDTLMKVDTASVKINKNSFGDGADVFAGNGVAKLQFSSELGASQPIYQYVTGAYGYFTTKGQGEPHNTASFMPLQWTVSGTVTQ